MANLKPLLDAAQAADAAMVAIRDQILSLANEGTEESIKKANDLRPQLEQAKIKADEANHLYVTVRDASLVTDNAAPLFVAPADPATQAGQGAAPKAMKRDAFQALSPADRMAFARAGGRVDD